MKIFLNTNPTYNLTGQNINFEKRACVNRFCPKIELKKLEGSPAKQKSIKEVNKILRYINKGLTRKEIAKKGFSIYKIDRVCLENNVDKLGIKNRNNEILNLLLQGTSRKEVAKKLNVSLTNVNRVAEENNVFKNKVANRNKQILEMREAGKPYKEIAAVFNMHEDSIGRILKGLKGRQL